MKNMKIESLNPTEEYMQVTFAPKSVLNNETQLSETTWNVSLVRWKTKLPSNAWPQKEPAVIIIEGMSDTSGIAVLGAYALTVKKGVGQINVLRDMITEENGLIDPVDMRATIQRFFEDPALAGVDFCCYSKAWRRDKTELILEYIQRAVTRSTDIAYEEPQSTGSQGFFPKSQSSVSESVIDRVYTSFDWAAEALKAGGFTAPLKWDDEAYIRLSFESEKKYQPELSSSRSNCILS